MVMIYLGVSARPCAPRVWRVLIGDGMVVIDESHPQYQVRSDYRDAILVLIAENRQQEASKLSGHTFGCIRLVSDAPGSSERFKP